MSGIETLLGLVENVSNNPVSRRDFLQGLAALGAGGLVTPEIEIPYIGTANQKADTPLESRIDAFVKGLRGSGTLTNTDEISVTVYDITHGTKIVSINEDASRMAASTIKNFVMLAFYHEVKMGRQKETTATITHLQKMIQRSNNSSTNFFIDLLGGAGRVNQIIKSNYPFFNETKIVESIPGGGRTYRNSTSSHDLNVFYNQLWRNELPHSDKMKHYLSLPKTDRIYDSTCIPPGVRQYSKSGTVYGLVADSGVLVMKDTNGRSHPYAITVVIEDKTRPSSKGRRRYRHWASIRSEVIRSISEGVYDFMYSTHTGKPYMCHQHGGKHLSGRQ